MCSECHAYFDYLTYPESSDNAVMEKLLFILQMLSLWLRMGLPVVSFPGILFTSRLLIETKNTTKLSLTL